jgi:uncharacterized membrane protein (DUF485 family)
MKNEWKLHLLFWSVVTLLLTLYYGRESESFSQACYFVTFLLPVAIWTAYFFNDYLVPKYLLSRRYFRFSLYLTYTIITALYLEMLVITISFIVLANYQYNKMNPLTVDVISVGITLFLIVIVYAFLQMLRTFQQVKQQNEELASLAERNQKSFIQVISDRKQLQVDLDKLLYIESLADYIRLHTSEDQIITREKISHLESKLPENFVRIHRSFIVNKEHVRAFTREEVQLADTFLPISRTYKKHVLSVLEE